MCVGWEAKSVQNQLFVVLCFNKESETFRLRLGASNAFGSDLADSPEKQNCFFSPKWALS